jgi:uncharacterized repeat protein (TIGR03847 family)
LSNSFELDRVDHLTTGTVGPPGRRVFYLQARQDGRVVTLRIEKTLVAALVRHLGTLLADLPPPGPLPTEMALLEPTVEEWVVGGLGAAYDEDTDRVVVLAEELVTEEGGEGAVARFSATREQVAALTMHGAAVVEAGRPTCSLCGHPIDPEGHVCVRLNGNRPPTV